MCVMKTILVKWEYYLTMIIPISQFLLRQSFINSTWCIDLWLGPIMTDDKMKLIMDFWFRLEAHWGQAIYPTWRISEFIWVCAPHFWFGVGGWVSVFVSKVTLCEISEKQFSYKFRGMCRREEAAAGIKGLWGVAPIVICYSLAL